MKRILEQIVERYTEGNYLFSSSDKAQMVSEILDLLGVTNRTFKCNRCGTIYTLKDGDTVGCCVTPVEHRTSGICGGELIEVI